jgi:hypothetical protein
MAANCVVEKEAIHAIDDAIAETKRASIDDGKDLNDHAPVDARLDHTGRLHRARQLLDSARQDISHEEDRSGPSAAGLDHIDKAIHEIDGAIHFVEARS